MEEVNGLLLKRREMMASQDNMVLALHWDGTVAPVSGKWYDDSGNRYFTLTNGTHGEDYYEFINNSPSSATSYGKSGGTSNGRLPDLGYHWKVIVDLAVRVQSSNPSTFSPIDFGSLGSVSGGKCAAMISWGGPNNKWGMNAKFNGNSSASTYNPTYSMISADPGAAAGEWVRRKIAIGVRASQTQGKDETFQIVYGIGECYSATPYTPLRFNRWEDYIWLGRSKINPTSNYKYATSTRIYDIKAYYEPIS